MTQTTMNRQVSLLVQGIFKHHKIDNFQAEVDIVSALQRMVNEGQKDPARMVKIREEILSAMLAQGRVENTMADMETRIKSCMGISVDGRSRYKDMVKFLVDKDAAGQKVETYAQWCKENPFEAPKSFQISMRPDLLMETWLLAFPVARPVTSTGTVQHDPHGVAVSW